MSINLEELKDGLSTQANEEIDNASENGDVDRHYCQDKVRQYIGKTIEALKGELK